MILLSTCYQIKKYKINTMQEIQKKYNKLLKYSILIYFEKMRV